MLANTILRAVLVAGIGYAGQAAVSKSEVVQTTVSIEYAANELPSSVTVTTQANIGASRYLRVEGWNGTLIHELNYKSGVARLWISGEGHSYESRKAPVKGAQVADNEKRDVKLKPGATVMFQGQVCTRQIEKQGEFTTETLRSVTDPGDFVASKTTRSGKLVLSFLQVQKRPCKPEDLLLFTMPKGKAITISRAGLNQLLTDFLSKAKMRTHSTTGK